MARRSVRQPRRQCRRQNRVERSGSDSEEVVLERYPAEQGLGSVVGYVALGSRHGMPLPDSFESVSWRGEDGHERCARIPLIYFLKEKRDELV